MSSNIRITKVCEYCGKEFTAKTTVTQYCSQPCASKAYKRRKMKGKVEEAHRKTKEQLALELEMIKAKEFLTVRDVAKLLNCSRPTVYTYIKEGRLEATNLGERKTLIKRESVDKLFE